MLIVIIGDEDVDNGEERVLYIDVIKDFIEDLKVWVWLFMCRMIRKIVF